MHRPTAVTVVASLIIAFSVVGGVAMLLTAFNEAVWGATMAQMRQSPIPVPVQLAFGYVGLAVAIVCGAFLLRGANWARVLYLTWCMAGLVVAWFNVPSALALIPGALKVAVFAFFLTRADANRYFAASGVPDRGSDGAAA